MLVIIDGVRYVPEPAVPVLGDPDGDLGAFLRGLREREHVSLDEAAKRVGISKTYLWEIETGNATDPSFRVLVGLSRAYGFGLESAATFFR